MLHINYERIKAYRDDSTMVENRVIVLWCKISHSTMVQNKTVQYHFPTTKNHHYAPNGSLREHLKSTVASV